MTDHAETLLRSSVEHLGAFSRAAFGVGLALSDTGDGAPHARGLSRPIGCADGGRRFLLAQGFLQGDAARTDDAPGRGDAPPRHAPERLRLLDAFLDMAAGMLGSLEDAREATSGDPQRESLWRELLGAPTILGVSAPAGALREALPAAANSREPLFLAGEPGSGRRGLAAAVHRAGPRAHGPFVAEDLATIPAALRESELFGAGDTPGLLAAAAGGTLYLAGVEHLPGPAQARLLEHLDGSGTGAEALAPARIIAAAATDLDQSVRRGRFRRDLADRLTTLVLAVPPLRDRPEDIPLIAVHLLRRRAAALGETTPELDPDALDALKRHTWAGNVRELDEELARAGAGRAVITPEDLPAWVARAGHLPGAPRASLLRDAVSELEAGLIARTLAETSWNKSHAARVLGLSRLGLQKKIDRYGIDRRR
jgi:DNA-binding NtrC family response regulator